MDCNQILKVIKTKLFFALLLSSFFSLAQYTIDDRYIEFTSSSSVADFYQNTYFNAEQAVTVEWIIIKDSMPSEWQFSNCFPSCFAPGITSGSANFQASSKQYLNCHFYPNNTAGEGLVQMQLTINGSIIDTVTWKGIASDITSIDKWSNNFSKDVVAIYNLFGQKIDKVGRNKVYILQYKDGSIRKIINLK